MVYLQYHPRPPLSEFVDYLWQFAGGEQASRKELILPSGTIELVINLREDEVRIYDPVQPQRTKRFSGAVMSGTYSNVFICDARQHESMLGVHFKPGGAFPFLGTPASELCDAHSDLEALWGRSALELRERLCTATTPERFRVAEEVLVSRLCRSPKPHRAVQIALDMIGPAGIATTVRDIAREAGLCQRRFIQLFEAQVGLTPKLFLRLLRFQRARTLAEQIETFSFKRAQETRQTSTISWAQLASACGYYDQSHLIHDFQEFSGLSPAEYLRRHQPSGHLKDNHVPLLG